jgi:hypothetical protein
MAKKEKKKKKKKKKKENNEKGVRLGTISSFLLFVSAFI